MSSKNRHTTLMLKVSNLVGHYNIYIHIQIYIYIHIHIHQLAPPSVLFPALGAVSPGIISTILSLPGPKIPSITHTPSTFSEQVWVFNLAIGCIPRRPG